MDCKIAVVGGGLAGLAAVVKLLRSNANAEIHLYERSPFFGGRASSFWVTSKGIFLDYAQHVSMKRCLFFRDFLQQTGLERFWRTDSCMTFCSRRETEWRHEKKPLWLDDFRNTPGLPVPFHLAGSFFRMRFLNWSQRWEVLYHFWKIRKSTPPEGISFDAWLRGWGASEKVRRFFWETVLFSAFSESPENLSAREVRNLLLEIFGTTPDAWHLLVPQRPLWEIFHEGLQPFWQPYVEKRRFFSHPGQAIQKIECREKGFQLFPVAEEPCFYDSCILAVPWHQVTKIFPPLAEKGLFTPETWKSNSIAAIHTWLEKPLFSQPHVATPGKTIQWIFRPPFGSGQWGHYHQLLISDSDRCASSQSDILQQLAESDLQTLFPDVRIREIRVTRFPSAVFSIPLDSPQKRPSCQTPWKNLFLAGDWTDTGFPATMEGAVKSGFTAAQRAMEKD
ncbi:MAG: hydroxysqualene dehydroxylase HpnE [Planctomycetia bacterium]|nr:hydroxysqualene dehydroxylase HpnE [Planctomycetia bacterium]